MKGKTLIALMLITVLAVGLRFYRLDKVPNGFHIDEAAIGYNAWQILTTGKDEWGTPYPLLFKSFGDYKAPGMIYTVALSEKIFGRTEFAVRFPAAIAGVLSVVILFFFVFELTKSYRLSAISSFLLAISPWHLQFSRLGFEASLGLLFTLLGMWLFFRGLSYSRWWLTGGCFFLALAVMTYHAEKVFVPIILLVLILANYRILLNKKAILALVFGGIFFLPYLPTFFSSEGRARLTTETIFGQKESPMEIFQNNYAANFSLNYLFFRGDQNGRHSVKKLGELYIWQLPFVLAGIYFLIKSKPRLAAFSLIWLLIAAIPVGIVRPGPHALRNFIAVPMWQFICAYGVVEVWNLIPKKMRILFALVAISAVHSILVYLDWYYVHSPKMFGPDFGEGFNQAAVILKKMEPSAEKISISSVYPSIYLKFYGNDVAKYTYFDSPSEKINATYGLFPTWMLSTDNQNIIKTIKMENGDPLFYVYKY